MHKKIPKKPIGKSEKITDENYRLRKEALELAQKHKDIKVDKYLLK